MKRKTWFPEREDAVARGVEGGKSAGQIAYALGLTRNQVLSKVRRMGLRLKSPHKAWTDYRMAKLRELAEKGLTTKEAAIILEVSRSAIVNQAHKKKIHFRPDLTHRKREESVRKEFIEKLYVEKTYVKGNKTEAKRSPMMHPAFFATSPTQKLLEHLTNKDCRFPIIGKFFCAQHTEVGKSFCPEHAFLVYKH